MKVDGYKYNNNVSFQYKNILKTLYLRGRLPSVKYGIYGKKLTKKTTSLEHLKPHSQGGESCLSNFALADKEMNRKRGSSPLSDFIKIKTAKKYLRQFIDVVVDKFNGNDYIRKIIKTLKENNIDIGTIDDIIK